MSSCIYCTFLVFIQWARSYFHNSRPETDQWFLVCLFLFNKSTTIFHGPCCLFIDRGNDGNMFKTQVESRAAGGWFHYKVLNILPKFAYDMEKWIV